MSFAPDEVAALDDGALFDALDARIAAHRAALVTADASRTLAEAAEAVGGAVLLKPLAGEVFDAWLAAPGEQ